MSAPSEHLLHLVQLYRDSIDHAENACLAAQIWEQSEHASLIFPLGNVCGWQAIRDHFYKAVMADKFTQRVLTLTTTPRIDIWGNTALVQFDWEFTATARADGSPVLTRGRESQVWRQSQDDWRLFHVHYSLLPA